MSQPPPPADAGEESSPFSRPGFLVAAGVVLVLIVLAGFIVFTGGDGDEPATPAPPSSATSTALSTDQQPADDACDLPADDQTVPVSAPDTDWTLIGTVAAPSSNEAGPAVEDPDTGLRSCYARTPTGALFAAANFLAAVNDETTLVPAVDELAAEGPGRDVLLELARTQPETVLGSGTGFQIAGFTYLSATEDTTSISIAIGNTGGLAAVPVTVVWEDENWKVHLPPDGNLAGAASPLSGLTGYIAWAGA